MESGQGVGHTIQCVLRKRTKRRVATAFPINKFISVLTEFIESVKIYRLQIPDLLKFELVLEIFAYVKIHIKSV